MTVATVACFWLELYHIAYACGFRLHCTLHLQCHQMSTILTICVATLVVCVILVTAKHCCSRAQDLKGDCCGHHLRQFSLHSKSQALA